jgi:hypothetical protein
MREYTAKATTAQITTRRMVSHVDRDIRSSCLARTCLSTALANILLHNVLVCIRYRKTSTEKAAYGECN